MDISDFTNAELWRKWSARWFEAPKDSVRF